MSTSLRTAASGLRQAANALAARAALSLVGIVALVAFGHRDVGAVAVCTGSVIAILGTFTTIAFAAGLLRAARSSWLLAAAGALVLAATVLELTQAARFYGAWVHNGGGVWLDRWSMIGPALTEVAGLLLLVAIARCKARTDPLVGDATIPIGLVGVLGAVACTIWLHPDVLGRFEHWQERTAPLAAAVVAHVLFLGALRPACRAGARWLDTTADASPPTAIVSP